MPIFTVNTPTEIRGLAQTAGRGLRVERRQAIELRDQANERANQALALQQRQQAFGERLQIEQLQAQQQASEFDRGIQATQQNRLERDLLRQMEADRDRSETSRASLDQAQRLADQDKQFKAAIEQERGGRQVDIEIFRAETANEREKLRQNGASRRSEKAQENNLESLQKQFDNRIAELEFVSSESNKRIEQSLAQNSGRNANILVGAQQAGIVPEGMFPHLNAVAKSGMPTETFSRIVMEAQDRQVKLGSQFQKAMQITSEEAIEGQIEAVKTQLKVLDDTNKGIDQLRERFGIEGEGPDPQSVQSKQQVANLTNRLSRLQTQKGLIRPAEFNGTITEMDRLTGRTGSSSFKAKFIDLSEQELRDQVTPAIRQKVTAMQQTDPAGLDKLVKDISGSETKLTDPEEIIEILTRQAIATSSLLINERARQIAAESNWQWE